MPQATPEYTLHDLDQAIERLESLGIAEKTGEFRLGRPVYRVTEFGRKLSDEELSLALERLRQAN